MDAEQTADMIVARLRAETSKNAQRPPYALGILALFSGILVAAIIYY